MTRTTLLAVAVAALITGCEGAPSWDVDQGRRQGHAATAEMASKPPTTVPETRETPEMALADFLAAENISETPVHRASRVDLDGDGRKDLLMLLEDRHWCGSGGCTLLVFHGGEAGYRLLSRTRPTRPPIAVSPRMHSGWHDLLVGVGGGGIVAGTVALQFNGSRYPDNPTLLALLSPEAMPAARVVID